MSGRGFSAVVIILIVVIVLAVVGGTWYYYKIHSVPNSLPVNTPTSTPSIQATSTIKSPPNNSSTANQTSSWNQITDPLTGLVFSVPNFGVGYQVQDNTSTPGETFVNFSLQNASSGSFVGEFALMVYNNPTNLNLHDWFESNIDINDILLSQNGYQQQTLEDGSVAYVFAGIPEAFYAADPNGGPGFLFDAYTASSNGEIIGIERGQGQDLFDYGYATQDAVLQLELQVLATARFEVSTAESTSSWPTYKNADFGFEMKYPAGWYFQAPVPTDGDSLFYVSQTGPGQLLGAASGGGTDDEVSFAVDATSSYGPGVAAWISPEGYSFSPTQFNFNGFIGNELISGETSTDNAFEHILAYKILPSGKVLLISWFRGQGGDSGNTYSYEQYLLPMLSSLTLLNGN